MENMYDMEYMYGVIKEGMIIELLENCEYCIGDREYIIPKGTRGEVIGVKPNEIMVRWDSGDWVELVPDYDIFAIVFGAKER